MLFRSLCCGRTFLSAGLVDEARVEARRMLEALRPWVQRGMPVIGLEPSCLFSLRDEFTVLLPESGALAGKAVLFEEFLAAEQDAGRLKLDLMPLDRPVLLHGHCHQKAFGTMAAVEKAIRLVPGVKLQTVESSCCGDRKSTRLNSSHMSESRMPSSA